MSNKWKKLCEVPQDDKNYFVSWRDWEGNYSYPHLAYYVQSENKFFSLQNNNGHPLHVDIYIEMPELPNE